MNDYLTKPINPAHLQKALTKALASTPQRADHGAEGAHSLFDEPALLARTDDDREFARELIALFVPAATDALARLAAAVHNGEDPEAIRKLAHSLKGSAATASAGAMAACAANLERLAHSAQAVHAFQSLQAVFTQTAAEWERLGYGPVRNGGAGKRSIL
jgi:HPt (histidine-containing phosphotransfer) domain-containing protein